MNPYEESVTHRHQPRAEALIPMHNCYGGDYGYVPNYAAKYSRIYPDAQSQVNAELGQAPLQTRPDKLDIKISRANSMTSSVLSSNSNPFQNSDCQNFHQMDGMEDMDIDGINESTNFNLNAHAHIHSEHPSMENSTRSEDFGFVDESLGSSNNLHLHHQNANATANLMSSQNFIRRRKYEDHEVNESPVFKMRKMM